MTNVLITLSFIIGSMTCVLSQNWTDNFNSAKETAQKQKLPILMVFQGSDWCAPCMKLDHQIWQSEEFKQYASEHYVLLRVDFPKRKKNALSPEQQEHNNALAATFNTTGIFPLVVLMDADGKTLGSTGYKNVTASEYIDHLNSLDD